MQALSSSSPVTVLVLTPSVGGHYFGELIGGLVREIASAGGRIVLVQTLDGGSRSDEETELSTFSAPVAWSEVDGVVSVTTAASQSYLQRLRDAGKPVVLASTRMSNFDAPLALPDNFDGTFTAVEHLIGHGHTRIGFVGNLAQPDVSDRYAAYLSALETNDLSIDPALVFAAPNNDYGGGVRAALDVLAARDRPTALMVATDRNAIGLMRTLTNSGLALPRDIAVIGFDNMEEAGFSSPTLTSVNQRFDEVGALAGRLVLAQIRGEAVSFAPHILPAAPVKFRRSCGCTTNVLGSGVGRRSRSLEVSPTALGDELEDSLRKSLLTGHGELDVPMRQAVHEIVSAVTRLVHGGSGVRGADIQHLTTSLIRLTGRPDALRRITGAVLEYVQRSATTTARDHGGATAVADLWPLTTALWQLQAGTFLQQADTTRLALEEQYVVDTAMLDTGHVDPRRLGWLAATDVPTGVLALWEGDASSGRLRIVGTYDEDGLLPDLVGIYTTPEQFPPRDFIDAALTADRGVCIVVPVCTRDHDWGLLAVVGVINTTSDLQTYRHWAAQLCASVEAKQLQEAVRVSEERYALAARASNDGLWEWNVVTGDAFMSERCAALLGVKQDRDQNTFAQWMALIHPDDIAGMRQNMSNIVDGRQEIDDVEYRVRVADGSYRWVLSRALGVRAPNGSVERVVGSMSDIHERRSLEDQLRENALYDSLTGLPNRRLFLSRLDHAVALWHRSQTPFAVVFLDLDGFKAINDTFGHLMGDRILNVVGARIIDELRGVDTGARFGGDEFAILLSDTAYAGALLVAQRLQTALTKVIDLDGREFAIGASLGVATSSVEYASAEDVLRAADTAMYRAKESGRQPSPSSSLLAPRSPYVSSA